VLTPRFSTSRSDAAADAATSLRVSRTKQCAIRTPRQLGSTPASRLAERSLGEPVRQAQAVDRAATGVAPRGADYVVPGAAVATHTVEWRQAAAAAPAENRATVLDLDCHRLTVLDGGTSTLTSG
jgi:hypothetical protein